MTPGSSWRSIYIDRPFASSTSVLPCMRCDRGLALHPAPCAPVACRRRLRRLRLRSVVVRATAFAAMAQSPRLTYFAGRGRAEQIRWLLAATAVEWTEAVLHSSEQFKKLAAQDCAFGQVPLLEIDGLKLVQTQAIIRHLARRGELVGKSASEQALADSVAEAALDFRAAVLALPFSNDKAACVAAVERYAPAFERLLDTSAISISGGEALTYADVLLAEACTSYNEAGGECAVSSARWPRLAALVERVVASPLLAAYLAGPQRYPFPAPGGAVAQAYVSNVRACLG